MTRRRLWAAGLTLATASYFSPWAEVAIVLAVAAMIVLVCAVTEPPALPRLSATADDVYARARAQHTNTNTHPRRRN